jgi:hypothetical protein
MTNNIDLLNGDIALALQLIWTKKYAFTPEEMEQAEAEIMDSIHCFLHDCRVLDEPEVEQEDGEII